MDDLQVEQGSDTWFFLRKGEQRRRAGETNLENQVTRQ
jgi:hypothetical protein